MGELDPVCLQVGSLRVREAKNLSLSEPGSLRKWISLGLANALSPLLSPYLSAVLASWDSCFFLHYSYLDLSTGWAWPPGVLLTFSVTARAHSISSLLV